MQKYEIMTIASVSLGETGATKVTNEVKDLISHSGGKVLNSDNWGKRKFAYQIGQDTEGYYEVISFELDKSKVEKLKPKLNLVEGLVRYLITAQK